MSTENSKQTIQQLHSEIASLQREVGRQQAELDAHKALIAGMESSKFWKLRRLWMLAKLFPAKSIGLLKMLKERGPRPVAHTLRQHVFCEEEYGSDVLYEYHCSTRLTQQDAERYTASLSELTQPLFSIVMPVYNVEERWLIRAIESVIKQVYQSWELCIVDDASTAPHIQPLLKRYAKLDSRIKVQFSDVNGGISAASNIALGMASGDYIALLDNDDELSPHALYENALLINQHPEADFVYSDEDKIDVHNHCRDPFFKPEWSPDYFHSCMYTCHFGVYRTWILREIGGFRSEFDGAQDWDLVLRVVEKTNHIFHIAKVLYHWRMLPSSMSSAIGAKPWAYQAAQRALADMVRRSAYSGWVDDGPSLGLYRVRRDIVDSPLVSIIIPSAGTCLTWEGQKISLLEQCIDSIRNLSTYKNIEIVVVDGYDIPETTLTNISNKDFDDEDVTNYETDGFRLVRCDRPFNHSERMNLGVEAARGDFLLMLNDDIQVITPDWIETLLEFSQQEEIGAVGARLLYPDGLLQHAGVLVLDGAPTHAFHKAEANHYGYYGSSVVNRNYVGVTAACLMMRREIFTHINGFDEDFPLDFNDVDLCLRICQAGYRNVFTPYAELIHYESASRDRKFDMTHLDRLRQKFEGSEYMKNDPYYNPNLSTRRPFFEIALPSE